jgi:hypothetical protein
MAQITGPEKTFGHDTINTVSHEAADSIGSRPLAANTTGKWLGPSHLSRLSGVFFSRGAAQDTRQPLSPGSAINKVLQAFLD